MPALLLTIVVQIYNTYDNSIHLALIYYLLKEKVYIPYFVYLTGVVSMGLRCKNEI